MGTTPSTLTIREVALRAKVSPATVSMALNGRGTLSAETRRRVRRVAAALNYKPRAAGRPRREERQPHQLAMVVPQQRLYLPNGKPSRLLERVLTGARRKAIDSGAAFSFFIAPPRIEDSPFATHVEKGQLDGIIFGAVEASDPYVQWLLRHDIPVVLINRDPGNYPASSVMMDNVGGGRCAANHLLELGHRRLAYVRPIDVSLSWSERRGLGFRQQVEAAGAQLVGEYHLHTKAPAKTVEPMCRELLEAGVTGVFAVADGPAVQVIDALANLGVDVPGQMSVIGFDDIGFCSTSGVRPTSVTYDKPGLGQKAVTMLLELVRRRGEISAMTMMLPTRIRQRASSGPPPETAADTQETSRAR